MGTLSAEAVGVIISALCVVAAAAIAYGRLRQTVKSHSDYLEGCAEANVVTADKCEERQQICSRSVSDSMTHLTEQLAGLKDDVRRNIVTLQGDLKRNEEKLNRYQQQTAGALGRIEGTLKLLVQSMKEGR